MIDYDKPQFKVCANCKYWDYYELDEYKRNNIELEECECHRYPPSVVNIDRITSEGNIIPVLARNTPLMSHCYTFGSEWCGEFEPDDNPMFPDGIYMP